MIFSDKSDSDDGEKMIFSTTRPDDFSVKAYLIDLCKCSNCNKADPKEEVQDYFGAITYFLFRQCQKDVRQARLNLASAEQTFYDLNNLISKRKAK